jgi:hypothetical protein
VLIPLGFDLLHIDPLGPALHLLRDFLQQIVELLHLRVLEVFVLVVGVGVAVVVDLLDVVARLYGLQLINYFSEQRFVLVDYL